MEKALQFRRAFFVGGLTKYKSDGIIAMGNKYRCIKEHFTDKKHNGKNCPYDKMTSEELSELAMQEVEDAPKYEEIGNIPPVEEATGFADNERLNTKDHIAHARDMGYKNQKEYEKGACEFFNFGKGDLYFSKKRKRFFKYDNKKLLCVSSDGVIHTFMIVNIKKFNKMKVQEDLWKIL